MQKFHSYRKHQYSETQDGVLTAMYNCCHLKSRALHPSRSKQSFRFVGNGVDLPSPGLLHRSRFLFFLRAIFAGRLCFFDYFLIIFFLLFLGRIPRSHPLFLTIISSPSPRSLPVDEWIDLSPATAWLPICVVTVCRGFYCVRAIFLYFFFSANFKRNQQNAAQEAKDLWLARDRWEWLNGKPGKRMLTGDKQEG